MSDVVDLHKNPIHLGLGATAVVEPEFTGDAAWYMGYMQRHAADGAEGRVVAVHRFTGPWGTWEMHPMGAEVVMCLSGRLTLFQKDSWDSEDVRTVVLEPFQAIVNPPGVWHTADVSEPSQALFITAGAGTENRDR